jgi:hypothetical protein
VGDAVKKLVVMVVLVLGFSTYSQSIISARAGCRSDCEDQYNSNVTFCSSLLSDIENSDSLETCMNNAERVYDTCVGECEDENEAI